ncbi:MAG: ThiF family adenylyltransferase [Acidobacteriota bacterium]
MRYSRQILFQGIGEPGQRKIEAGRLAVIGCGALGTVSAEMLVRAGVGHLRIIDRDFVEESNLQRQSLFIEADVRSGIPKAIAAQKALQAINSGIKIEGRVEDVTFENIGPLCDGADILIDGTDNFETRYLVNDFAVKNSVPWIYGACVGSYGISVPFLPGTFCLQCFFEQPPDAGTLETCDTAGILSPAVHAVAAYQVTQAMRILVKSGSKEDGPSVRILQFDLWEDSLRLLWADKIRNPDCPCCGKRQFRFLEGSAESRLVRLCGRNAVQVKPRQSGRLDFSELAKRLERTARVRFNQYMMRIEVNGWEIALFPDGRSIIKGTDDFAEARSVYARYIGS